MILLKKCPQIALTLLRVIVCCNLWTIFRRLMIIKTYQFSSDAAVLETRLPMSAKKRMYAAQSNGRV